MVMDHRTELLDKIIDSEPAMLMVYADWCGYCKKMKKVMDALVQYARDKKVKLYKINYEKAPKLCKENGVNGFPCMLANFGERKYSGYRDEPAMRAILDSAH
jgi:thiol-disulfide isomerase/thioredoxin